MKQLVSITNQSLLSGNNVSIRGPNNRVRFLLGTRDSLFSIASTAVLGSTYPPIKFALVAVPPGGKWPMHEAEAHLHLVPG
jgi:hypothetical protein